jgi:hypothetical protein
MSKIIANNQFSAVRRTRESTIMVKGSRLRSDSQAANAKFYGVPGLAGTIKVGSRQMSYIQQCDLGRTVHLDREKKSYTISNAGESDPSSKAKMAENAKKGGYIDVAIDVKDTGERRNMFGFVAKHLISTTVLTPSANACNKQPFSFTDEGWYIDLPTFSCEIPLDNPMEETSQGCVDEIHVKSGGNMHLGFALQQTRTMTVNGMSVQLLENVISLDRATLDSSLFEIPSDYHATSDSDANIASSAPPSTANSQNAEPPTTTNVSTNNATQYPANWQDRPLPQTAQLPTDSSLPPKEPGVVRIGVVTPTAEMGQGFEGVDSGQIAQVAILEKLKGEHVESVPISSGVLIASEAKLKQCDYLLYTDIKRKKGGGGFMKQMIITSVVSSVAGLAGNAASAAATAASAASQAAVLSGNLKNKDEISLEYHLNKADGSTAIAPTTLKKKAQKDGDDVLSPMIGEAATGVINALAAK